MTKEDFYAEERAHEAMIERHFENESRRYLQQRDRERRLNGGYTNDEIGV